MTNRATVNKTPPRQTAGQTITDEDRSRLVRLAYRFLWNRDDAEDVVQDALMTAHRRQDDLRDGSKRWSWTCGIVIRNCHALIRRRRRREHHDDAIRERVRQAANEGGGDPAGAVSPTGSLKDCVRGLIPDLPIRQREVLVLRHLEGWDYQRIADVLGICPSTARVLARQARERLLAWILEKHPGALDGGAEGI